MVPQVRRLALSQEFRKMVLATIAEPLKWQP